MCEIASSEKLIPALVFSFSGLFSEPKPTVMELTVTGFWIG